MNSEARKAFEMGFERACTARLRAFLEKQRVEREAEEFELLYASLLERFGEIQRALEAIEDGVDRALWIHARMDEAIDRARPFSVSCREGCSGCCHLRVEMTRDEAELLISRLERGEVALDRDRLKVQWEARDRAGEPALRAGASTGCVFLGEDQRCRVYEIRPMACRRLLVRSLPELCWDPEAEVQPVEILEVELLMSAVLSLPGTRVASLPEWIGEHFLARGQGLV
jgi:hypothetical protein